MTTDDALTLIAGLPDVRMTIAPIGASWYCGINYRGGPLNGIRACRSSPQASIFGVARQVELQPRPVAVDDLDELLGDLPPRPKRVKPVARPADDLADLLG